MKYINADELKLSLLNFADRTEEWEDTGIGIGIRFAINALDNMPSADVVEIKHGHWIKNDNETYSCSLCQSWIPNEQYCYARFCLHCGADMRGCSE